MNLQPHRDWATEQVQRLDLTQPFDVSVLARLKSNFFDCWEELTTQYRLCDQAILEELTQLQEYWLAEMC